MPPSEWLRDRRRGVGRRRADRQARRLPSRSGGTAILEGQPARETLARDAYTRRLLGASDAAAALVALVVVVGWLGGRELHPAVLLVAPLVVGIHKLAGLYDRDDLVLRRSTADDIPELLQLSGLYALVLSLSAGAVAGGPLPAGRIAALWAASFVLTTAGRWIARTAARRAAAPERCLVIGDRARADHVRGKLASSGVRAHVVATIPLSPTDPHPIRTPEDMRSLVERHWVDRVVLAPVSTDSADTIELIRIAKAAGVRVSLLPRMFEAVGSAVEFEQIDGMTMLGVRRFGLTASSRAVKRAFDVAGAAVGLLACAPLLLAIAAAVRFDSAGPVFFRQTRVGRDGRPFRIFKFRTMGVDAESRKADLLALNEAGDGMFKLAEDPRVTTVGRWLRRTSLDELPQLINVLRGEMSLVGPRPLVLDEDARVLGLDRSRLYLTPGMTGPWQVLGATRVPMEEMVGLDYLYVANWTLWADVKLLLRTVPHVLASRGL
ncbi:MAG TPA: exopolysaccharide biosynthesis polyprenyl glycosylphosphotransferase [Solirubrobacteraceae bacterium]